MISRGSGLRSCRWAKGSTAPRPLASSNSTSSQPSRSSSGAHPRARGRRLAPREVQGTHAEAVRALGSLKPCPLAVQTVTYQPTSIRRWSFTRLGVHLLGGPSQTANHLRAFKALVTRGDEAGPSATSGRCGGCRPRPAPTRSTPRVQCCSFVVTVGFSAAVAKPAVWGCRFASGCGYASPLLCRQAWAGSGARYPQAWRRRSV